MARFVRRGFKRGGRVNVGKNSYMRVWVAFAVGDTLAGGVATNFIIAQPAGFATTSGNTKHIGTLVRVRATLGLVGVANTFSALGVRQVDVAESATPISPLNVAYGQDEDVLDLQMFVHPTATVNWNATIDIKAKRRWDVENELSLDVIGGGNGSVFCVGRALFLVP